MWYLFNGKLVEYNQPVIPLDDRGLMYGDGCFDTLAVYNGAVLGLDKHLERLKNAMAYLEMPEVAITDVDQARKQITRLLKKNNLMDKRAWVRFQIWRTGKRGYQLDTSQAANWALQCKEYHLEDLQKPVALATVPTRRVPSSALNPIVKLTNGINYIKAAQQAKHKGADDALMLTVEKYISETTKANLFWLKGDSFYTPSKDCDLLPGITRQLVIECVENKLPHSLKTGMFELNDLYESDYVFLCNSLRQLVPVRAVDHITFSEGNKDFSLLKKVFEKCLSLELFKLT